jgi:uracil-DNA glycosylase family 4
MPRLVYGDGPEPCDIMFCGERPGHDEARQGRGFVGPAGKELWDRLAFCGGPRRHEVYVTNLVKSFSVDAPKPAEILTWGRVMREELRHVRPKIVITVGAHAMRWFIPGASQDSHHGLLHRSPRFPGLVMPIVHSSAALRQPERYQKPFTEDCEAVADVYRHLIQDRRVLSEHRAVLPSIVIRSPTAAHLGCDTEGTIARPECVTFSDGVTHDLIRAGKDTERHVLRARYLSRTLIFHNAPHDYQVLARILSWADILALDFDDTMLMAYLLGEHVQGLKPNAFRHGLALQDYGDLLGPIDESHVRLTLENWYATYFRPQATGKRTRRRPGLTGTVQSDRSEVRPDPATDLRTARQSPQSVWTIGGTGHSGQRSAGYVVQRNEGAGAGAGAGAGEQSDVATTVPAIPARAFTSVRGILTKPADTSLRDRWSKSKFAPHCPLPPEPTWEALPDYQAIPYACGDAEGHWRLDQGYWPRIEREGLVGAYRIDRAVLPMVARMEWVGMQVNADTLRALSADLETAYMDTSTQIADILGYDLNVRANEDVAETLFNELGISPTKLTKSGKHYTTQDKYLEARKSEHEVVPLVIQGREQLKLLSSYTRKLPSMLRDGRYFPHFGYTRTASGRLSETIILLIPKHSSWGKQIRCAFEATDGHALVSCDLSQIELRVLAHMARDRAMIRIFEEGRDPHAETAHELLGAPKNKADQDDSRHRLPAKKGNFGAFMGLSPAGLTEQIRAGGNPLWASGCPGCDDPRADHERHCDSVVFFREYWKKYQGVTRYIATKHAEADRDGYVRDLFGAKIYVHGIWSTKFGVVARAKRMAQATPVQATADRLSKIWMKRVWDDVLVPGYRARRRYAEPWCRVHDDTILEVDARSARKVARRMLQLVPQRLCIPVGAEAKYGPNWGELT